MKTTILAIVLSTSIAEARSPNLRSIKNLFVKHKSSIGVYVASAALSGTCVMRIMGCGPDRALPTRPSNNATPIGLNNATPIGFDEGTLIGFDEGTLIGRQEQLGR